MKKAYLTLDVEVQYMEEEDILRTSNVFDGDTDEEGWT